MKEKILAFLKTHTKLQGVQESFLLGVAEHYSKTVTEETQIATTFTDGVVDLIKFNASYNQIEGDRRSNSAVETFRKKHNLDENGQPLNKDKDKDKDKGGDKDKDKGASDEPEWFKKYRETTEKTITGLNEKLQAQEKEKATAQLTDKVRKHEKLKDIPASFLKGRNLTPESEDKIEQLVTDLAADWNTFKQEQAEKGVHIVAPAQSAGGPGAGEAVGKSAAAARNKADSAAKDNPLINNKQQ